MSNKSRRDVSIAVDSFLYSAPNVAIVFRALEYLLRIQITMANGHEQRGSSSNVSIATYSILIRSESRKHVLNTGLSTESLTLLSLLTSTKSMCKVSMSMVSRRTPIFSSPIPPSASSADECLTFRESSMSDLP
jgi:hypothetical protein